MPPPNPETPFSTWPGPWSETQLFPAVAPPSTPQPTPLGTSQIRAPRKRMTTPTCHLPSPEDPDHHQGGLTYPRSNLAHATKTSLQPPPRSGTGAFPKPARLPRSAEVPRLAPLGFAASQGFDVTSTAQACRWRPHPAPQTPLARSDWGGIGSIQVSAGPGSAAEGRERGRAVAPTVRSAFPGSSPGSPGVPNVVVYWASGARDAVFTLPLGSGGRPLCSSSMLNTGVPSHRSTSPRVPENTVR